MMDEAYYEVKSFIYDEDGPGEYLLMAMRMETGQSEVLDRKGWRGSYTFWFKLGTDVESASREYRVIERQITARDDHYLSKLMQAVEYDGAWGKLKDGEIYTPEKIDEVFG